MIILVLILFCFQIGEPLMKTFGQQFTEKKPLRRSVKSQARPKGLEKGMHE